VIMKNLFDATVANQVKTRLGNWSRKVRGALHMLGGVRTVNEIEQERGSSWYYHVADHSDPAVLTLPEMLVSKDWETEKGEETDVLHTNIFGNTEAL
jgi:hypothetical protein